MNKPLLNLVLGGIIFWLLLLTTILWCTPQSPIIGVIDLQALVVARASQLASLYPDGQVPKAQLQDSIIQIKNALKVFTTRKPVVLLNKNLVLNEDVTDYTEDIQTLLNASDRVTKTIDEMELEKSNNEKP
jgi:hypothetical protein